MTSSISSAPTLNSVSAVASPELTSADARLTPIEQKTNDIWYKNPKVLTGIAALFTATVIGIGFASAVSGALFGVALLVALVILVAIGTIGLMYGAMTIIMTPDPEDPRNNPTITVEHQS